MFVYINDSCLKYTQIVFAHSHWWLCSVSCSRKQSFRKGRICEWPPDVIVTDSGINDPGDETLNNPERLDTVEEDSDDSPHQDDSPLHTPPEDFPVQPHGPPQKLQVLEGRVM